MDRMSPLDAAFRQLEDGTVALHLGAVAVFDGPPPTLGELRDRYGAVVRTVPRFRERMRGVPFALQRPVWVDDPGFDVARHVERAALPAPGDHRELMHLVGEIMSTRLDPTHPLWQAVLVEGLAGDRWALVWKIHHSVVDGGAAMEILHVLLDRPDGAHRTPVHRPRRQPETAGVPKLVASAVVDGVRGGGGTLRRTVRVGRHPIGTARAALGYAHDGLGYVGALARPVRSTSLIGPLGSARRYRTCTVPLADVDRVRHVLGGTVNDIALTLVTRGFRELLIARHEAPAPHSVRSLVPVSVREAHGGVAVANQVSALLLDLPVEFADAVAVHGAVRARMAALKRSGEATAGAATAGLAARVPAPLFGAAVRVLRHLPQHVLATVTTNVPGPPVPRRLLGRDMVALYPYVPIGDDIRIGVALTSYRGELAFGVTCDRDSVPDADVATAAMRACLDDLLRYADRLQEVRV